MAGGADHVATTAAVPIPLSVIVPIGPGDPAWRGLLSALETMDPRPEILLVFSRDDPLPEQAPQPATVLSSPTGRARQLNAGIAAAQGEYLWLLHADSRLRDDTVPALREWLAQTPRALGWFRLAFEGDGAGPTWLNACCANLRATWLGLPFGDQGFVVHRDDARRLGPFDPALAFGEDHAWVWRARRIGLPLRPVGGTLGTSARKYAANGWAATTWRHLRLTWRQARQESRR